MATVANEWLEWARNQAQTHFATSSHGVKLTLPPKSFFKFPPSDIPATLPVPLENPNSENPFVIPPEWYNALLSPNVPITFALVYATVITYLNSVNTRRNLKPWAISKTRAFTLFVIIHNIFLSLYSLWTFLGMLNALRVSVADPREYGLAATVDSLCKIHGPRGHGSAATFSERDAKWSFTDRAYHLAKDGINPDSSDVGRIWNEGLAYYGWLFYISKFYEVVDTLIIIAKGKKSSFLQTYHHAGAMLCMWAGIRYMSPPIWMFVFVNSFIHFVMYAFYTSTTLGVRVPKWLKQILTTLQITQFVVGASYAFGHYFIAYQVPVSIPYIFHLGDVVRGVATSIKSDATSALSVATATASADTAAWLKKLAFRAAGREGLAENVENQLGQTFGIDAVHAVEDLVRREETRYRNDLRWVHCLDTSGETFAIYLNIFYLAPLTWLFLQFFVKAYIQRVDERRRSSVSQKAYIASQSIGDARRGVGRRLSEAFEDYQGANGDLNDDPVIVDGAQVRRELQELVKKTQEKTANVAEIVGETAQEKSKNLSRTVSEKTSSIDTQGISKQVSQKVESLKNEAQATVEKAQENLRESNLYEEMKDELRARTSSVTESAKSLVQNSTTEEFTSNAADTVQKVEEKAEELAMGAGAKAEEIGSDVKDEAVEVKNEAEENVKDAADKVGEQASGTEQKTQEQSKDKVEATTDSKTEEETSTQRESTDEATVQEGKTFAEAAAEGVPEDNKGETTVVDEAAADETVKKEDAEGA